jgi:putative ABC transport system permease protein
MMHVAIQMLMGDRLKYLSLIGGVAFAALLITQQAGILIGLAWQTGSFVRDTSHADVWLMDPEVRFSQDAQPFPDTRLYRARGVEGVDWAVPMFMSFVRGRLPDGARRTCIMVGIDDATLIGGPPTMIAGQLADLRLHNGLLVSAKDLDTKLLVKKLSPPRPLRVGDRMSFNDEEAIVVGTYEGSPSFFWEPMVYTTYSRAARYVPRQRDVLGYVLVKAKPGTDLPALKRRLESVTGLAASTNDEFIQKTMDYILKETGILINFGLAVGLGFLVGALIVAQMLYNFTLDNLRQYAALKAMGAGNVRLLGMVLLQAMVVGGLGYGIGVGLGAIFGEIVARGGLAFRMPWQIPVFAFALVMTMCVIAAVLSMWRVLRLEPAVVFKA